jgi:hypothetical protein
MYSPYTGGIYSNDLSNQDLSHADYYENYKLAEVTATQKQFTAARKGFAAPELVDAQVPGTEFAFQLSAAMRDSAKKVQMEKAIEKARWAGTLTPQQTMELAQFNASNSSQLTAGNIDSRVEHVRTIPLIPKIIGEPPMIYFLEQMFATQNVEKLDARVAEQDGLGVSLQKGPRERTVIDRTDFDEHRFNLKRNSIALVWSTESQIRSDFDLKAIDFRNARIAMARARELQALIEFSKLTNVGGLTISDPEAANASGFPASANNPTKDLVEAIARFNTEQSTVLTHLAWNPIDFVAYASNFFTMQTALTGPNFQGYGVVQTPKIPGVVSVVSPMMPRGFVYGVDQSFALKGEGPFVTEMDRDEGLYSDVGYMHDFVQFLIPNPNRAGIKLTIDGVTAGTEITSLEEANALLTPKADLQNPS